MIVQQFQVTPQRTVDMTIDLLQERGGYAVIYLKGEAPMPCYCGEAHVMSFEAELGCGPDMEKSSLDDLEGAIRGNEDAARRLGWRLLSMLFHRQPPPCTLRSHARPQ